MILNILSLIYHYRIRDSSVLYRIPVVRIWYKPPPDELSISIQYIRFLRCRHADRTLLTCYCILSLYRLRQKRRCIMFGRYLIHLFGVNNRRALIRSASTIFALSSGRPPSAIAIIRISGIVQQWLNVLFVAGPLAGKCLRMLTTVDELRPHHLFYTSIRHPTSNELLDRSMAVYMPGKMKMMCLLYHRIRSEYIYRRRLCRIACAWRSCDHRRCTRCIIDIDRRWLSICTTWRIYSTVIHRFEIFILMICRAFLNGKIDLTTVEAIDDLIGANTRAQRQLALDQYDGRLSKFHRDIIDELTHTVCIFIICNVISKRSLVSRHISTSLKSMLSTSKQCHKVYI